MVLDICQAAAAALTGRLACGVLACIQTSRDERGIYTQRYTAHRSIDSC